VNKRIIIIKKTNHPDLASNLLPLIKENCDRAIKNLTGQIYKEMEFIMDFNEEEINSRETHQEDDYRWGTGKGDGSLV
jgi:hypothetical protein